jgi:hypothetical protein
VSPLPRPRWQVRRPDLGRVTSRAAESTAYVVTALTMCWPLTFDLGSGIAGWRDARYYAWANWRAGQMLSSGDPSLRIRDIVWPYGVDIRHLDGQLPTLVGGLWNLVASPELAHNLALLTGVALNLWAGRRLGKVFSRHRAVWALTAIAFATAPAIAARFEVHFTMYFAFPLALLLEDAVRVARKERPLGPLRLGLLLVLAYLCGIYLLAFGGIAFGLVVLLASVPRELPRLLLRASVGVVLALVLLSPFVIARLELDRAERSAGRNPELLKKTLIAAADGLSIAAQPSSATFDLPGMSTLRRSFRATNVHESTIFPGALPLLLGFGGLLFLRSPLRWPLLFTTLGVWLLALGTSLKIDGRFVVEGAKSRPIAWLPYTAFFEIPGLASLRSPNRASFTLAAVLVAAAAMSLGWLFSRFDRRWQHVAMSGVGGALLLTNLMIPIHEEQIATSPALESALRTVADRVRPGEGMVEVPADCNRQTHTVVLQILHRTPLVGCQTSYPAIPWRSDLELYRTAALAGLRCDPRRLGRLVTSFTPEDRFEPRDLEWLRDELDVRFLLVHRTLLNARKCATVRTAVLPVLASYEAIGGDREWFVVDTGPLERPAA